MCTPKYLESGLPWSTNRREWCCHQYSHGCLGTSSAEHPSRSRRHRPQAHSAEDVDVAIRERKKKEEKEAIRKIMQGMKEAHLKAKVTQSEDHVEDHTPRKQTEFEVVTKRQLQLPDGLPLPKAEQSNEEA